MFEKPEGKKTVHITQVIDNELHLRLRKHCIDNHIYLNQEGKTVFYYGEDKRQIPPIVTYAYICGSMNSLYEGFELLLESMKMEPYITELYLRKWPEVIISDDGEYSVVLRGVVIKENQPQKKNNWWLLALNAFIIAASALITIGMIKIFVVILDKIT